MSGEGADDEGDGFCGVLAVAAQLRRHPLDAGPMEEADGGVAEQGDHGRPLADVDQARILPEGESLRRCSRFSIAQWPRLSASNRAGAAASGVRLVIP